MRRMRILWRILKNTNSDKIISSYVVCVLVIALLIWFLDPAIKSYPDSLWYCYTIVSTAGFGDMVATTPVTRILSIILSLYSVVALAIITGVIVNYYTQIMELKNKETIAAFLDKIERLEELTQEELRELSDQVRRFRK